MSDHEVTLPFVHAALDDVRTERYRQWAKFGDQSGLGRMFMLAVLMEEVGEVAELVIGEATINTRPGLHGSVAYQTEQLRAELVQVAAVAVQIIEHIDTEAQA